MKNAIYAPLLILSLMTSSPSFAHSLEDAEAELQDRERYAQFVDQPAPAFSLTDVDSNIVSSSDLEESVVVLNFIYTRCKEACPVHMNLIAEVQGQVNDAGLRDEVEFITIATDSEDIAGTRNNMRAYGTNFDFDPANWRFLYRSENEPADTTRQVAETYGLKFDDVAEGVQSHGVVTHVIDQSGRMRARFHGLEFAPEHLVDYVEVLVKGPEALSDSLWGRIHHYVTNIFN
ncbi:SCO family protein [Halomonas sp. LBP4]|uniref:SCO family protein n=1 Tax=Halomonas sp. LBP4 TaxID=2044917 RepID=UPI0021ACACE5|nr:SCO family protein [Halomonas sp. LBP4]